MTNFKKHKSNITKLPLETTKTDESRTKFNKIKKESCNKFKKHKSDLVKLLC